jgi:hypothetical protein
MRITDVAHAIEKAWLKTGQDECPIWPLIVYEAMYSKRLKSARVMKRLGD